MYPQLKTYDKVLYIKDKYETLLNIPVLLFEKNKYYTFVFYDERDKSVAIEDNRRGITWWYFTNPDSENEVFSEYFITQKQYRKQKLLQLNETL